MRNRRTAGLIAAAVMAVGLAAPASADTGLIQVLSPPKLKVGKKVSYVLACSANCTVSATLTLTLKHGTLSPATVDSGGPLAPASPVSPYIVLNRAALKDLKSNSKAAKLKTTITATDLTTGAVDSVERTFKFKK